MLSRGIIKSVNNARVHTLNIASGSRRSASSGPTFLPGSEMSTFTQVIMGGLVTSAGYLFKLGVEKLQIQNEKIGKVQTDVEVLKNNTEKMSEDTKYIRDRLDRRWF